MSEYLVKSESLTAIADAVRSKTGETGKLSLDAMAASINSIKIGVDTSDATATAGNILKDKTAYVNGTKLTGTIPSKAASTITPTTSNQTIAAGQYLSGAQTIAGDADLKAANIKKGVNIFGVAGSYDAISETLNFTVVGGTSAPSSPAVNTIWVNTSTSITSWYFCAKQPGGYEGRVWIKTGTSSTAEFNALKKNGITVYPLSAKQYINGVWVDKTAKSYQGSKWVNWYTLLFDNGDQFTSLTGEWAIRSSSGLTCTIGDTLLFTVTGTSARAGSIYTKNKINVSNFSTLEVDVKISSAASANNGFCIGLATDAGIKTTDELSRYATKKSSKTVGEQTIFLDISGMTGSYYVVFFADVTSASVSSVRLIGG